jgi:hypothetical protein
MSLLLEQQWLRVHAAGRDAPAHAGRRGGPADALASRKVTRERAVGLRELASTGSPPSLPGAGVSRRGS